MLTVLVILTSGCDRSSLSSGPIFFEFKQQPGDKYVYKIHDQVEWRVYRDDTLYYTMQHWQEQTSVMQFIRIDSTAVRHLDISFRIERDSVHCAAELAWLKKRKSPVGRLLEYRLRMRPNGEILSVENPSDRRTFFYNKSYRPSQPVFPMTAIAPGYSWEFRFTIDVPPDTSAIVTSRYKFRTVERVGAFDCAVIDFRGELDYLKTFDASNDSTIKDESITQEYWTRTVSEGRLYFAYREGFVVKKVNLITSTAKTRECKAGVVQKHSRTEIRDHETITLREIHHSGGEKMTYWIQ
ncbi:MAG: hypothetical protein ONB48_00380 [candidate division KSB1 bacterium]|nr:hypothetical protein [candidate division KSB1 bacterium]MDZ7272868.1 hypothetical protein [candidate division KSB1 bacterium]MDZ7284109.1 hypothetical protein [candidate division KSB1 bacterium]MDZ7297493.1 hypothetical protein [candidate division KSB1 bacterium]MDZ7348360.1 hypothetical protein [candidate division KSB1 bacterium]